MELVAQLSWTRGGNPRQRRETLIDLGLIGQIKKKMKNPFMLKVSVSPQGYASKEKVKYDTNLNEKDATLEEFAGYIGNGHLFCSVPGERRGKLTEKERETFTPRYFVAIDGDGSKGGRQLNKRDYHEVKKAYSSLGINATITYETFSSTEEDVRFRLIWVLNEPITDIDTYITISEKLNGVYKESTGNEADDCNTDIVRMFNGTNKPVQTNERCLYTPKYLLECLNGIIKQKRRPRKSEPKNGIDISGEAVSELRRDGVEKYLIDNERLETINNNLATMNQTEEQEYTVMDENYREMAIPFKISKDGSFSYEKLKDGEHRRRKIRIWAGTLANWFRKDETILEEDWKRHFIFVIANLVYHHIDTTGLTNCDIADNIEEGAFEGYDGGKTKKFKMKKRAIMEKQGIKTEEEWNSTRRRIAPEIGAKIRKSKALAMYDFNKSIKENAVEIGVSVRTLKKYLGEEEKFQDPKEELYKYVEENHNFGYKTLYRMMVDQELPFAPKSDRTIYNIYKRNGFDINGTGKTNNAIEAIEFKNSEDHERYDSQFDRLTHQQGESAQKVYGLSEKLKNKEKEIAALNSRIEELEIERESFKIELETANKNITECIINEDRQNADIATLNEEMVNTTERVSALEVRQEIQERNYQAWMKRLSRNKCIPREKISTKNP